MTGLNIKKYVQVKDHVTPGMLNASHHQFWNNIKDRPLRVLAEDKSEMIVRDADGEQHNIRKELLEPYKQKEGQVD